MKYVSVELKMNSNPSIIASNRFENYSLTEVNFSDGLRMSWKRGTNCNSSTRDTFTFQIRHLHVLRFSLFGNCNIQSYKSLCPNHICNMNVKWSFFIDQIELIKMIEGISNSTKQKFSHALTYVTVHSLNLCNSRCKFLLRGLV